MTALVDVPVRGEQVVRFVSRFVPWPFGGLFSATDAPTSGALLGRLQMVALLPRVSLPLTCAVAAAIAASVLLPVGFTLASGLLVGAVPGAVRDGLSSVAGRQALLALAGVAALSVAQRVLWPVRSVVATMLGQKLELHLEERVMRAVGRPAGVAHLEDAAVLDRIALAQEVGTAGDRPGRALTALTNLAPQWLLSVAYALVLAQFRWWLALGIYAAWYYASYVKHHETVRMAQAVVRQTHLLRRSNYVRDLALTPGAAKEVRVFGLTPWLIERFHTEWRRSMDGVWGARRGGTGRVVAAMALLAAALVGAGVVLGLAALRGEISLGALAVFTGATLGMGSFLGMGPDDRALELGAAAVPAVFELEQLTGSQPASGNGPVAGARPTRMSARPAAAPPRGAISFEGVTFRYPGTATDTLAGLDLTIPVGRSVAIVGANGAGKTTLIKLLCRFYDPQGGRIAVDGVDLREVDAASWQRHLAAIFQDFVRHHLPLRDNVAFGAPEAAADERRLSEAARQAGALDLVAELPNGWDTILSREFSGGVELSGGQWQRVALARALFAAGAGATVLILDEPTAALDVRAEAALYDRFLELASGLTTVLISHRFSTVRRADHIVVLESGRVLEQGSHDTLMAADGRYAEMFTLQAQRFAREGPETGASRAVARSTGATGTESRDG